MTRFIAFISIFFLAVGVQLKGAEDPSERTDSQYSDDQARAIDWVDQLSARIQGMPWSPSVVGALSGLGTAACQHDRELGNRIFERAYSVADGIDFDLDRESSIRPLVLLASESLRCRPELGFRLPTVRGDSSELEPQASSRAMMLTWPTNPEAAVGFAQGATEGFSDLREQQSFVAVLIQLRRDLPSETDAVYQQILRDVKSSGSVADLFTLGNYVFGPQGQDHAGAVGGLPIPGIPRKEIFDYSATRPGVPGELATQFITAASEMVAGNAPVGHDNAIAFGMTKQLASWAQSNDPRQVPVLESLLAAQRAQPDAGKVLAAVESSLRRKAPIARDDPRISAAELEKRLESTPDGPRKESLRFNWATMKIQMGKLEEARGIAAGLEDRVRQPLLAIIDLQHASETIAQGDLEAARLGLSKLTDDLHLALAALSLASAYWNLSEEDGGRRDEDVRAAVEAIHLASAATGRVNAHVRPALRLGIARVLALTEQFEESILTLELAVQEFNAAKEPERQPDNVLSIEVDAGRSVYARVASGIRRQSFRFRLVPPILPRTDIRDAIRQLSASPGLDLGRLEGIVRTAVSPRLQTQGLIGVAEVALTQAFDTDSRPPENKPRELEGSGQGVPDSPSTADQKPSL
ncbi:MAG: hypothetical protein OXC19_10010 [Bryobacterales bacterium]|nr:hypothetical protein [Bryobacterales bacterium]